MKIRVTDAQTPHIVFAWLPVAVFDRATSTAYVVWFEKVERRLISIGGAVHWAYSLPTEVKHNGKTQN